MKNENAGLDGLLSNYLSLKRKEKAMPYFINGENILDVGCGINLWEDELTTNQNYLGIDIDNNIIEINNHNSDKPNQKFMTFDFDKNELSDIDSKFDTIIMLAIIEHFENPKSVLKKITKLLKPNGKIIITTPAPYGEIILDFGAVFGIFAKDKHEHQELFNRKRLKLLADNCALEMVAYEKFLYFQNQLAVFSN